MASWIILDWDHDQFHVLSATSSRRGIHVAKAATWAHPEPFTPSTAERVGKALRDFLKSAGIAPAPVIVGLGRDRIFLKELRIPPIAAHEEAALVRFQTAKELTEPGDNYAVDYVQMHAEGNERQIMTVAARRDIVASVQTLCQAAGLKLHAVTPRLFGIALALQRAIEPEPNPLIAGKLNVVLSIGQRWAELCFFQGARLIQAQALANGPLLVSEVKRNLAVFRAQHAVDMELTGPDCLYVFGDDPAAMQTLQSGQALPIHMLNPLRAEPEVAAAAKNPAFFAGSVGLALLWSHASQRPVNLASPKKASAPTSLSRQRGIVYGSAAAVLAVFFLSLMYYVLNRKQNDIQELVLQKQEYEKTLNDHAQERAELAAYNEWEQSTIPWLDEMYDLTARYPYEIGFRVNQFNAKLNPVTAASLKKGGKDGNFPGTINLAIVAPNTTQGFGFVVELEKSMARDPHVRASMGKGVGAVAGNAPKIYEFKIDVAKQGPEKYTTHLTVPRGAPQPQISDGPPIAMIERPNDDPDGDGDEP